MKIIAAITAPASIRKVLDALAGAPSIAPARYQQLEEIACDLVGRGRMSKRGSRYLRTAVMQASEIAVFKSHDPLFSQVYQKHVDRGKHHLIALSHVANKMLHVVFSVLKNNRPYTPILN